MRIISSVHMEERFITKLMGGFPNYKYIEKLELANLSDLAQAEVLITYGNDITPALLDKMDHLKWIHIMQSGMDNLPFEKLIEKEILLTNAKGINSVTIAEYLMGMMLNVARNSYTFYEAQKRKEWDFYTTIEELSNKTIGILGFGAIGKELAKRAKAFDMKVIALKRTETEILANVDELLSMKEKDRIFSESDFVISLLPLTEDTRNYIGKQELSLMKSSAYLLNVSRGNIIHYPSLLDSLQSQQIAGAVLDVFHEEPLAVDSELWNMPNVFITPHVAGDRHPTYMVRAFDILYRNLQFYVSEHNNMINVIDIKQGY